MSCIDRLRATLVFVAIGAACAKQTTQPASVAPEPVRAEQLTQRQFVIESDLRDQQRVDDVGHALLAAATPFCGDERRSTARARTAPRRARRR